MRGATGREIHSRQRQGVSIHAPRAGCDSIHDKDQHDHSVSIHAPRAGCDSTTPKTHSLTTRFNSRTPCGVRQGVCQSWSLGSMFQFTHPVRGATHQPIQHHQTQWFQFTHPVRGATWLESYLYFSKPFQFTHPVRGATGGLQQVSEDDLVSIHAPRAGCDTDLPRKSHRVLVSIHAPRAGCDHITSTIVQLRHSFNSRTPCGVRLDHLAPAVHTDLVSIHAPRAGCDAPAPHD